MPLLAEMKHERRRHCHVAEAVAGGELRQAASRRIGRADSEIGVHVIAASIGQSRPKAEIPGPIDRFPVLQRASHHGSLVPIADVLEKLEKYAEAEAWICIVPEIQPDRRTDLEGPVDIVHQIDEFVVDRFAPKAVIDRRAQAQEFMAQQIAAQRGRNEFYFLILPEREPPGRSRGDRGIVGSHVIRNHRDGHRSVIRRIMDFQRTALRHRGSAEGREETKRRHRGKEKSRKLPSHRQCTFLPREDAQAPKQIGTLPGETRRGTGMNALVVPDLAVAVST